MRMSEQVNEIAKAMSVAQGQIQPASKDSSNPHFKSKFSSLAAVWDVIRDPLTSNGLSVMQDVTTQGNTVSVETKVLHNSGQWMDFGPLVMPLGKLDPQSIGSASTYAKRYALCAAFGVVSNEDDDGETAMNRQTSAPQSPVILPGGMSESQYKFLSNLLSSCDAKEIMDICKKHKVSEPKMLTAAQASEEINRIQEMRKKNG